MTSTFIYSIYPFFHINTVRLPQAICFLPKNSPAQAYFPTNSLVQAHLTQNSLAQAIILNAGRIKTAAQTMLIASSRGQEEPCSSSSLVSAAFLSERERPQMRTIACTRRHLPKPPCANRPTILSILLTQRLPQSTSAEPGIR